MNKTIENQLNHRSIRKFKDIPIDQKTLDTLLEVGNRTASSTCMQSFSIIRITDSKLKYEISKVCKQDYVNDLPELIIFIVDEIGRASCRERV